MALSPLGTEPRLPPPLAATSVDKGECIGGATLSLLHDRSFSYTGDSQAQELCLHLTKAASTPYFEILEKWIYRGIIDDPYRWAPGRPRGRQALLSMAPCGPRRRRGGGSRRVQLGRVSVSLKEESAAQK